MDAKIQLNTGVEVGIAKRMNLAATRTKGAKINLSDLGLQSPFSRKSSEGNKATNLDIPRRPSDRLVKLVWINAFRTNMAIEVYGGQVIPRAFAND